jgi:nucleoside triphosphatase
MRKQQYPEPTVGALIFNQEDKVLLLKSDKWRNKYVIPGGHIELGETMEDALRREVKEETGLDIYDIEFVSLQESIFDEAFHEERHFMRHFMKRGISSSLISFVELIRIKWC